jgi:hypothetical protein
MLNAKTRLWARTRSLRNIYLKGQNPNSNCVYDQSSQQVKIGLLLDLREYLHKDFLKINLKVNKASK